MINISITHKILIGFIIVTFLGILSNLFTLLKFGNISLSTQEISAIQDAALLANGIEENLKLEQQLIQDYYDHPDSSTYNGYVRATQSFNEQMAAFRFKAFWADNPILSALNKIVTEHNDLLTHFSSAVFTPALLKKAALRKQINILCTRVDRNLYELKKLLNDRVNDNVREMNDACSFLNKMILFLLFFTGLISIIFCLWIVRSFIGPFRKLLWNIRLIGQGQFDQTVEVSSSDEEIQALIEAFQNMQKQLKKYRDHLIETERLNAVNLLATSVSHEVNNPLMIISGTAEYIRTVKSGADEEIKEKMETIVGEVQRISSITRKLTRIKQIILEDYSMKDNTRTDLGSLVNIESSAEGKQK
jgi:C4-dicarboxylate-specific signal transduction histidine kinase